MKTAFALAVLIVCAAAYVSAHAAPVTYLITYNPGGVVADFRATARELARTHTPIIVDGPCYSSCTVLVDQDRAQVCITDRAVLGYHLGSENGWLDAQHSVTPPRVGISYATPGLNGWIEANGGLPTYGLLKMYPDDAARFYRHC